MEPFRTKGKLSTQVDSMCIASNVEFVVTKSSTDGTRLTVIDEEGDHRTVDPKEVRVATDFASWRDENQFQNKATFARPELLEEFNSALEEHAEAPTDQGVVTVAHERGAAFAIVIFRCGEILFLPGTCSSNRIAKGRIPQLDHAKSDKARIQLVMCNDTAALLHSEQPLSYEDRTSNVTRRSKVCITDADTYFTVKSNEEWHEGMLFVGNYNHVALLDQEDKENFHRAVKETGAGKMRESEVKQDHFIRMVQGVLQRKFKQDYTSLKDVQQMLKGERKQLKITHEEVRTIVTSCKNGTLSPSFSILLHEALRCEFMAVSQIFSITGLITHHCLCCLCGHSAKKCGGF